MCGGVRCSDGGRVELGELSREVKKGVGVKDGGGTGTGCYQV